MKKIAFTILTCLAYLHSYAEYSPLELYEMIIKADKIVYGTIIDLKSKSFTIKIEGSITGESGSIKVSKYEDWACAYRWTNYMIGQKIFLFLDSSESGYTTMSGGNEGELPIKNDKIYIHGLSLPPPPPFLIPYYLPISEKTIFFKSESYILYGDEFRGVEWDLNDFIETVSIIRSCFDFEYGRFYNPDKFEIYCDDTFFKAVMSKSKLIQWVYYESEYLNER